MYNKRKLRSDPSNSQPDIEVASSSIEEKLLFQRKIFMILQAELKTKSQSVCATLNLAKERFTG